MKYHIEKNTVQETLVIPLFGRLVCSEHFPELFSDPEAKRICDSLDYDFAEKRKKMESAAGLFGALEGAQRQYDLRCEVESYLKDHPKAAVANLGCGFDDKFSQVDNGKLQWFDVDLADQIAVRRKVYQDRDRCVMLEGDALNGEWTKKIPKSDMYIIVMEGVLEYFSKEQVRTCLNMLCDSFPHGFLLAELHCPFMEKNSKHHDAVKYTKASFGWGTKSGKEYLELEPRMTLVSERSYNEEMKKYSIRGKLFAIIGKNINNRLAVYKW